jgi:hypothetical protein
MPVEILIKTDVHGDGTVNYTHSDPVKDRAGVFKKGYPVTSKDVPHPGWGMKERLPWFVVVRITDATKEQVDNYLKSWERILDYEVLQSTPQGFRLKVFCTNPGNSGLGNITKEMVESYIEKYGGKIKEFTINSVTFDISKENAEELKISLQNDLKNKIIYARQFYIDPAIVDTIIAQGGYIEVTRTQFLNYVHNRLDE